MYEVVVATRPVRPAAKNGEDLLRAAIVSVMTGIPVRRDVAMTGEAVLDDRVRNEVLACDLDARWLADSSILYLSQQKLKRTPAETV